jgi:hypothetical protein
MAHTGAGTATLNCAGGNCTGTSSGQGTMNINCSGGGCTATCSGQGTCNITGCPNCTCTETVITASCNVN